MIVLQVHQCSHHKKLLHSIQMSSSTWGCNRNIQRCSEEELSFPMLLLLLLLTIVVISYHDLWTLCMNIRWTYIGALLLVLFLNEKCDIYWSLMINY